MPALEALACGASLVATNRGSVPEIVGDAAEIVDPLDVTSIARGLERVVNDAHYANTLRDRGPRRAATFSWQSAAQVTRAVLVRAAGTLPRAPRQSAAN